MSKKISITDCSGLLCPMRRLRKEEYLRKTENLDSARNWRLESQWRVVYFHSAAVCCCSRPMVGLFYKAVPVLADEDKIGGSAIPDHRTRIWNHPSQEKLISGHILLFPMSCAMPTPAICECSITVGLVQSPYFQNILIALHNINMCNVHTMRLAPAR